MIQHRKSNMELLRIIAMLFIVVHHLVINGIDYSSAIEIAPNSLLCVLGAVFEPICIIGVNLFFLLSGYFQIKFTWKKWIRIVLELYVYMFIIQMFGIISGYSQLNLGIVKSIIWPLGSYWFLRVYLFLMVVSPFLNMIVRQLNKQSAKYFAIVLAVFMCGYAFLENDEHIGINRGYSFLFACCLYLLGAAISKGLLLQQSCKSSKWFRSWRIAVVCNIFFTEIALIMLKSGKLAGVLQVYNSPFVLIESVCFFMIFVNMKIDDSSSAAGLIRKMSWATLDVYILHSSNKLIPYFRNIPMNYLVECGNVALAYLMAIPYAVIVFLLCTGAALVFHRTIGCVIKKLADIVGQRLDDIQMEITAR